MVCTLENGLLEIDVTPLTQAQGRQGSSTAIPHRRPPAHLSITRARHFLHTSRTPTAQLERRNSSLLGSASPFRQCRPSARLPLSSKPNTSPPWLRLVGPAPGAGRFSVHLRSLRSLLCSSGLFVLASWLPARRFAASLRFSARRRLFSSAPVSPPSRDSAVSGGSFTTDTLATSAHDIGEQ